MRMEEILRSHPGWWWGDGPKVEIVRMKKTPFIFPGILPDYCTPNKIKECLTTIFGNYAQRWAKENLENTQGAGYPTFLHRCIKFSGRLSGNEIMNGLNSMENFIRLPMKIDNSVLCFKRVGNSLAIKIGDRNGNTHRDGTAILKKLCEKEEVRLVGLKTRYLDEFVKKIVFTVPLVRTEEKSIDLRALVCELEKFCPGFKWGEDFTKLPRMLIEHYRSEHPGQVPAGKFGHAKRKLRLVHMDYDSQSPLKPDHSSRRGNVEQGNTLGPWKFINEADLFLQITIDGGLSEISDTTGISDDHDVAQIREDLWNFSLLTYHELSAMLKAKQMKK